MRLITELNEHIEVLTEKNEDGSKNYFIEGICLQGDIKNRNGRMYPSQILAKEVMRYTKDLIDQNRAYGELGHPNGPTINLDRVSHMFKSLRQEGSNFICRAKIMTETPMGRIVKNLLDEGANLGISSRGLGSLKPMNGLQEVQDDFMLATAGDLVSEPSGPQCFVKGLQENVDWIYDASTHSYRAMEYIEEVKKELVKDWKTIKEDQTKLYKLFEGFLKRL